jgi:preprotein translocase subunit SecG
MTVQSTIAVPAQQRHRSLAVWVIALAGLAIATVVAVFLATGGHKGTSASTGATSRSAPAARINSPAMASIMALTPARFAAGALGTGYALPTSPSGPTLASVLASMSPQTRRYTKALMSLTFAQLAAGAAGSP